MTIPKGETVPHGLGPLTENGLVVMLKIADPDKVDQVSPSSGAIVDVICGNKESAGIEKVYTSY